ncbi:hypothetical protein [Pseudoxanthomonas sp.]|uniref:hypothetical protein n=1 Tax=Pseudoxanthomonas sp. TaxID=1871049 RepID=UPI00261493BE|nr:hypothetical protein [Pseudoxanthomonas sp.]WDS36243.1 MAG: hypothetical protein O8I58_18560 [Pseudoxanthomonas sp.]
MATNLMDLYKFTQDQGALGQQQARDSAVRGLAPKIIQGDPQAYAQAAAIDPQAADQYQSAGDNQLRKLQGYITYMDKVRATGNPAAINAGLRAGGPLISQLSGKPAPTEWTPDMDAGWEEMKARVATLGNRGAVKDESYTLSPGSKRFDASGNVLAEVPMAPGNAQFVKVPDGNGGFRQMIFDPRTQSLSEPSYSGTPGVQQGGGGQPYTLGSDLSPEQIAAAQADAQSGATGDSYVQLPSREAGGMGYTAPKPDASQTITPYQQALLAGKARDDARADAQFAYQQRKDAEKASSATEKPMPIGAQKLAFDLQGAVDGANNIVSDMQTHLDALNDGTLDLSPASVFAAKARNASGFTDDKSRAYAAWDSDRQRLINDSLRLNKGVQTEGDAARAIKELQAASDTASAKAAFTKLVNINKRAAQQQQTKLSHLYSQYGLDANGDRAGGAVSTQPQRTPVRTGTLNGRKVVQYSDGTSDYAD